VASSKVVGFALINFVMYVAFPEYLFDLLLSLNIPFATLCPSAPSSVVFKQFGLFFVLGMIVG